MNKEQIYDDQINPLMKQIIQICRENHIAMICSFAIPTPDDADLFCSSRVPDETGHLPSPIKEASGAIFGYNANRSLMLTTQRADGSKTLTAFLD